MGFEVCDATESGFNLLILKFDENATILSFKFFVKKYEGLDKDGIVVYYTNRCPYSEYHVNIFLAEK